MFACRVQKLIAGAALALASLLALGRPALGQPAPSVEWTAVADLPATDRVAGLAVDSSGLLDVLDASAPAILAYDADGTPQRVQALAPGSQPTALAPATDGALLVADQATHRLWRVSGSSVTADAALGPDTVVGLATTAGGTFALSHLDFRGAKVFSQATLEHLGPASPSQVATFTSQVSVPGTLAALPSGELWVGGLWWGEDTALQRLGPDGADHGALFGGWSNILADVPTVSDLWSPMLLATGGDGTVWVLAAHFEPDLGRRGSVNLLGHSALHLDPNGAILDDWPLPEALDPAALAVGPDGQPLVVDQAGHQILRGTPPA